MEILNKINGYKTYIGLIITIAGLTGLSKYVTSEQLSVVLNGVFEIIGVLITIIGAIHKDVKIANLEAE
jgi:phage-related protein